MSCTGQTRLLSVSAMRATPLVSDTRSVGLAPKPPARCDFEISLDCSTDPTSTASAVHGKSAICGQVHSPSSTLREAVTSTAVRHGPSSAQTLLPVSIAFETTPPLHERSAKWLQFILDYVSYRCWTNLWRWARRYHAVARTWTHWSASAILLSLHELCTTALVQLRSH